MWWERYVARVTGMMHRARRLRIVGAGRRAQVVVDQLNWHFSNDYALEGFYDDSKPTGTAGPGGYPIFGPIAQGLADLRGGDADAFLAMGTYRSWRACEVLAELQTQGVRLARLVAPTAHVSPSAVIGDNALVMAGVFIGAEVMIGHLFTAHGGVVVEHHGQIGHNVLLGPGTALAGLCQSRGPLFPGHRDLRDAFGAHRRGNHDRGRQCCDCRPAGRDDCVWRARRLRDGR